MADSGPVSKADAALANLHLDEVTGERISKSELKRRQKLRDREEKKREKAAAEPPKAEKKVSAEEEESNLSPNVSLLCWLWREEPKRSEFPRHELKLMFCALAGVFSNTLRSGVGE